MRVATYGLLFAVLPLVLALLTALRTGKSMWNEADGGGGYIWLLYITIPRGIAWFLIISVVSLLSRKYKVK